MKWNTIPPIAFVAETLLCDLSMNALEQEEMKRELLFDVLRREINNHDNTRQ